MKSIKKRRKERKTDYMKRMNLLKSEKPRLVFRKTNKYVIAQYVLSDETLDKVEFGFSSKELLKKGFPKEMAGSLKSLPACYLLGYLIGKKVVKEKKEVPVMDFGMERNIHGSRIYAFLNGFVDAGVKIKYHEKVLPAKERIEGKHLKKDFSKTFSEIKSKIDKE